MVNLTKGQKVNRADLASIFGVSPPTVDVWVRADCPVVQRGSKGVAWVFDTAAVMAWHRDRAVADATDGRDKDGDALDIRKKSALTQKAELELLQARRLVAPVREFELAMAKMCSEIRANVMNVPQRIVVQLLGCTDETEFKSKLRAELTKALTAAANAEIDLIEAGDDLGVEERDD